MEDSSAIPTTDTYRRPQWNRAFESRDAAGSATPSSAASAEYPDADTIQATSSTILTKDMAPCAQQGRPPWSCVGNVQTWLNTTIRNALWGWACFMYCAERTPQLISDEDIMGRFKCAQQRSLP